MVACSASIMRARIWMIVPVFGLVALAALAQPSKKPKSEAKAADKAAPTQAQEGDADGAASTKADAGAAGDEAADDLGGPPPKSASPKQPGERLSPLTPRPGEFPDGGVRPPPADLDRLLGDIAALRSRVATLTTSLFASKIKIVLELEGDDARISDLRVSLDDGIVFDAPENFTVSEPRVVYEHAVAPGHHVVGVEVERYDARGKQFKTWQSSRFTLVVPEKRTLQASLSLEDDSDMAIDFPSDNEGQYDLRVRLEAEVIEP